MASLIDARSLEDQIRRRMHDEDVGLYDRSEILEAVDQALQDMQHTIRLSGRDYYVRETVLPISAFEKQSDFEYSYELPEYVMAPRHIEGVPSALKRVAIPYVDVPLAQEGRRIGQLVWTFTGGAFPGRITFYGRLQVYPSVAIWYVQRFPELHYGIAGTSIDATTLEFDDDPTTLVGPVIERDDVYNGMQVLVSAPAELRTIADYDGATYTATLQSPLGAVATDRPYTLIVPVAPEHSEYLIAKTVDQLFRRAGNTEWTFANEPYLARLHERFRSSIAQRAQGIPKHIWSGRG